MIPKFITRLLDGKPPIIYGDGEQTRDFVYVLDVVRANILAMESGATGVFNIAGGRRINLNELASILMESPAYTSRCSMNPRGGDARLARHIPGPGRFGFSQTACSMRGSAGRGMVQGP